MSTRMTQQGPRAKVTLPSDREIRTERIFNAPRELVWRAFTDPEWLVQWWGRGNPLTIEKYELQRGGHWRFVEHADGQDHGFEGRFREITPPEVLAMTFEWDGMPGYPLVQTIRLVDLGDGRTIVISEAMFYTAEERDGMVQAGMEEGLNESYEALDKLLASRK